MLIERFNGKNTIKRRGVQAVAGAIAAVSLIGCTTDASSRDAGRIPAASAPAEPTENTVETKVVEATTTTVSAERRLSEANKGILIGSTFKAIARVLDEDIANGAHPQGYISFVKPDCNGYLIEDYKSGSQDNGGVMFDFYRYDDDQAVATGNTSCLVQRVEYFPGESISFTVEGEIGNIGSASGNATEFRISKRFPNDISGPPSDFSGYRIRVLSLPDGEPEQAVDIFDSNTVTGEDLSVIAPFLVAAEDIINGSVLAPAADAA